MCYIDIALQAQKNIDVLNLFISLSAAFLIYFSVLFFSLIKGYNWSSLIANRTTVMLLLLITFIGSLFIAWHCLSLNSTSFVGICALIVIGSYLTYLYYYDPFSLVLLPARLERIYLFMVIIFITFSLVKMFLDMVGQGAVLVHAQHMNLMMQLIRESQENGGVATNQIQVPSPL